MFSDCASEDTGSGLQLVTRVGNISSGFDVAVDALRAGVWTILARLVYFRLTLGSLPVCDAGVETGVAGGDAFRGDIALLLAADSRRSRAGRTLFGDSVSAIVKTRDVQREELPLHVISFATCLLCRGP